MADRPVIHCRDCRDALTLRRRPSGMPDWYGERRGFDCTFPAICAPMGHVPDRCVGAEERRALTVDVPNV